MIVLGVFPKKHYAKSRPSHIDIFQLARLNFIDTYFQCYIGIKVIFFKNYIIRKLLLTFWNCKLSCSQIYWTKVFKDNTAIEKWYISAQYSGLFLLMLHNTPEGHDFLKIFQKTLVKITQRRSDFSSWWQSVFNNETLLISFETELSEISNLISLKA